MQNITNLIPTGTVGAYTSNTVPGVAPTNNISFQGTIVGTGTFSITVQLFGNSVNSNSGGGLLDTLSLSNLLLTDGDCIMADWPFMYAVLSNPVGTITSVSALLGV